jgi:hypothetical protein
LQPHGEKTVRSGLLRIFRDGYGAGGEVGDEDAFGEEGESGAAVHLPFDDLGEVVEAFDEAGAPGQGEGVGDGRVVLADPADEGPQVGGGGAVLRGG